MPEESTGIESKKKRGRPKGTKNKPTTKSSIGKTSEKRENSEHALNPSEIATIAEAKTGTTSQEVEKAASSEAAQKEYEKAATKVVVTEVVESFTNKRGSEQIFRREMGEPEFWLDKLGRAPPRPILSQDEEEEISRMVEIPTNQIPEYKPDHILSPEYDGVSNYELGIKTQKAETQQRLARLKSDPNATPQEIKQAEEDLKTLDYLYENYHIGMNVFRTAKGGRSKLRE